MDKFAQDAFDMAERSAFEDEFSAFKAKILNGKKPIMDAVYLKLLMKQKDPEKMAETILKSDIAETFSHFVALLMQVCFHVGYKAGRESMLEK